MNEKKSVRTKSQKNDEKVAIESETRIATRTRSVIGVKRSERKTQISFPK